MLQKLERNYMCKMCVLFVYLFRTTWCKTQYISTQFFMLMTILESLPQNLSQPINIPSTVFNFKIHLENTVFYTLSTSPTITTIFKKGVLL